jgi:ubiquinone/menaquinone biosynthesis C-methylase UbiE
VRSDLVHRSTATIRVGKLLSNPSPQRLNSLKKTDFLSVTELGGETVSRAQLDRFQQRYIWAGRMASGKEVLEMACGTGPGLGHLQKVSRRFSAGDIAPTVLAHAKLHYGDRIDLHQFNATCTPFADASFDVVILFEAIYYLPDVDALLSEVKRLLRPGGQFLIATANKDLFDFNPSPFSHRYFNPPELRDLLARHGFSSSFCAGSPVPEVGQRQRLIRAMKKAAVGMHLIPTSMNGKRLLKRLVFGKLVRMPVELTTDDASYQAPTPISSDHPDKRHQVLYCVATRS